MSMKWSIIIIIFITIFYTCIYYLYCKKSNASSINTYLDKSLLRYNITENSWCSIEINSYIILFYMCYNRIPNISMNNYYKYRMFFE